MAARKERNITRFDYGNSHGWWVRIRRGSRAVSQFFSDGIYGSKRAALAKALAHRDKELRRLGPVPAKRSRLCACGCGKRITRRYPSGRFVRFATGCSRTSVAPRRAAARRR
jgi:hypothetical protein